MNAYRCSSARDRDDYSPAFKDKVFGNDLRFSTKSASRSVLLLTVQRIENKDNSSHCLTKPGDLKVTVLQGETCLSDLQGERCLITSQTLNERHRHRLLRPADFIILLGPDAYSSVGTSSSEEDLCTASSSSGEISAPRMSLLKPCDFCNICAVCKPRLA